MPVMTGPDAAPRETSCCIAVIDSLVDDEDEDEDEDEEEEALRSGRCNGRGAYT